MWKTWSKDVGEDFLRASTNTTNYLPTSSMKEDDSSLTNKPFKSCA
jgi:hypothetical protein